jgi:hypothetical protein
MVEAPAIGRTIPSRCRNGKRRRECEGNRARDEDFDVHRIELLSWELTEGLA